MTQKSNALSCAMVALWLGFAGTSAAGGDMTDEALPAGAAWLKSQPLLPLWVVSKSAKCWQFKTWVAQSPEQFSRGLMFVRKLPGNGGMLFAMQDEREISMWMRNTFVSLDILFADVTGTIISIHENATPLSLDHISSGGPAYAVLELPAGAVAKREISEGDRLRHAHFGNSGCQDAQ